MDKIELFANLVNMAAVDNKFTDSEIRFLVERANRWNIPSDELETALAGIDTAGVQISIPESEQDRVLLIKELIRLMAVDGEMADEEREMCARVSARMEFSTMEFQQIVSEVIAEGN